MKLRLTVMLMKIWNMLILQEIKLGITRKNCSLLQIIAHIFFLCLNPRLDLKRLLEHQKSIQKMEKLSQRIIKDSSGLYIRWTLNVYWNLYFLECALWDLHQHVVLVSPTRIKFCTFAPKLCFSRRQLKIQRHWYQVWLKILKKNHQMTRIWYHSVKAPQNVFSMVTPPRYLLALMIDYGFLVFVWTLKNMKADLESSCWTLLSRCNTYSYMRKN